MKTPITTSNNNSQMRNDIMAAGSRERPPMLATGRYAQWQSLPEKLATATKEAVPSHTMMFDHNSSGLALQRQMTYVDNNTSGLAPQR
ncbi:hypothetical protein Tco_1043670 [Tanacetum coccineum]|uniref:Uncharacterized protein n=1 Tax=Tanacetum coccineum TaxID=301880 RepID=A0ABQ5GNC3_9ASTR